MTTPSPNDAFADLGTILANNQSLAGEPGVVNALQRANATPQEAGAVNAFLQALQLHKNVQILRSQGTRV